MQSTRMKPCCNPLHGLHFIGSRSAGQSGAKKAVPALGIGQASLSGSEQVLQDPDGKWAFVDDAVATLGGGAVCVAIQGGMVPYHGHMSSWKKDVASGVGGAAAGEAALYTGGAGSGAAGACL